jgi:hypothetical protein
MRPVVYPATAADVTAGFTPPIVVDYRIVDSQFALQYLASGGGPGAGTFQQTLDDPFAANPSWTTVTLTSGRAVVTSPVRAFRVSGPSAGDVITVVQQGGP